MFNQARGSRVRRCKTLGGIASIGQTWCQGGRVDIDRNWHCGGSGEVIFVYIVRYTSLYRNILFIDVKPPLLYFPRSLYVLTLGRKFERGSVYEGGSYPSADSIQE